MLVFKWRGKCAKWKFEKAWLIQSFNNMWVQVLPQKIHFWNALHESTYERQKATSLPLEKSSASKKTSIHLTNSFENSDLTWILKNDQGINRKQWYNYHAFIFSLNFNIQYIHLYLMCSRMIVTWTVNCKLTFFFSKKNISRWILTTPV